MTSGAPTVSVVVCTHRRPHLLGRALASVLGQTLDDLEVVVVDDASGDETPDVVTGFGDPRIRLLRNPENLGQPASRNVGIGAARGRYLGFLDDDDAYLPDKLARQVAALRAAPAGVGAAWCFAAWLHEDGRRTERTVRLEGDELDRLLTEDVVLMQGLLVRRDLALATGPFDPRFSYYDDYEWTLRLAARTRFTTVPEVLVEMHPTPQSITTDHRRAVELVDILLAEHAELASPRAREAWLVRRAHHCARAGDAEGWQSSLRAAAGARPPGLRPRVLLAAGLVGGPAAHQRLATARNHLGRAARGARRRIAR